MKIHFEPKDFLKALRLVKTAVPKTSFVSALQGVASRRGGSEKSARAIQKCDAYQKRVDRTGNTGKESREGCFGFCPRPHT